MSRDRDRLHFGIKLLILLTFFESLKILLINMVAFLMISGKMAALGLLKIKVFWNKGYQHKGTLFWKKVLSMTLPTKIYHLIQIIWYMWLCDHSIRNSSIFMTEVIITAILWRLHQQNHFLRSGLGSISGMWD